MYKFDWIRHSTYSTSTNSIDQGSRSQPHSRPQQSNRFASRCITYINRIRLRYCRISHPFHTPHNERMIEYSRIASASRTPCILRRVLSLYSLVLNTVIPNTFKSNRSLSNAAALSNSIRYSQTVEHCRTNTHDCRIYCRLIVACIQRTKEYCLTFTSPVYLLELHAYYYNERFIASADYNA